MHTDGYGYVTRPCTRTGTATHARRPELMGYIKPRSYGEISTSLLSSDGAVRQHLPVGGQRQGDAGQLPSGLDRRTRVSGGGRNFLDTGCRVVVESAVGYAQAWRKLFPLPHPSLCRAEPEFPVEVDGGTGTTPGVCRKLSLTEVAHGGVACCDTLIPAFLFDLFPLGINEGPPSRLDWTAEPKYSVEVEDNSCM